MAHVLQVLEQRASGRGWSKVDFSITSDKADNFISLPDAGLLRRLTRVRELSSSCMSIFPSSIMSFT